MINSTNLTVSTYATHFQCVWTISFLCPSVVYYLSCLEYLMNTKRCFNRNVAERLPSFQLCQWRQQNSHYRIVGIVDDFELRSCYQLRLTEFALKCFLSRVLYKAKINHIASALFAGPVNSVFKDNILLSPDMVLQSTGNKNRPLNSGQSRGLPILTFIFLKMQSTAELTGYISYWIEPCFELYYEVSEI